jgi:hypothetical protein
MVCPTRFGTLEVFCKRLAEAALSRMYGGIHFSSANGDGLAVELAIGAWTFKKTMRPR